MKRGVSNQIRIIGGKWRGRKLTFPDIEGLRPTPDRLRETLFNWLAPYIHKTRCLDLFAGSGALGFEALSRGAASVRMIEKSKAAADQIKANACLLALSHEDVQISCGDVFHEQNLPQGQFDIIFLDPPFHQNMAPSCCQLIDRKSLLAKDGWVYIEAESTLKQLDLPESWEVYRHKVAGQVGGWLCKHKSSTLP